LLEVIEVTDKVISQNVRLLGCVCKTVEIVRIVVATVAQTVNLLDSFFSLDYKGLQSGLQLLNLNRSQKNNQKDRQLHL